MCTVDRAWDLMKKYYVLEDEDYPYRYKVLVNGQEYFCFAKEKKSITKVDKSLRFSQSSNGVITVFSEGTDVEVLSEIE